MTRIGFVGLGSACRNHVSNFEEIDCDLVAGADVSPDARAAFTEDFGVETYEHHEEMYEAADLDGVIVTTPNAFHEAAVTEALDKDIATLCEKPLSNTLEGAEAIVDAHHESDAFCMVGFHNRFSTAASLLTEFRENGRFGDISHVEASYTRRRGIPGVGSWFTSKKIAGGGALIDLGVHLIDYALYVTGYPEVVEVSGATRSEFGSREDYVNPDAGDLAREATADATFDVDDSASCFLRCADGTTMTFEISWASNAGWSKEILVRGTDAGAECSLGGDTVTLKECSSTGTDHYVDTELEGNLEPSGTQAQDAAFVEGIKSGHAPEMNTAEEGLVVQRVLDAVYRSSEQNQAVSL